MIMTACKTKTHRGRDPKTARSELLPLEEYLQVKLRGQARSDAPESLDAIMTMAHMGWWNQLSQLDIGMKKSKARMFLKLIERNEHSIPEHERKTMLRRIGESFQHLDEANLKTLVNCMMRAGMLEMLSGMAAYPFIKMSREMNSLAQDGVLDNDEIEPTVFGKILCEAISSEGHAHFSETSNHSFVLLLFAAFHHSFAQRMRSVEEYLLRYGDEWLALKDVVHNVDDCQTAAHVIRRLEKSGLLGMYDPENAPESSILVWYFDNACLNGYENETTKYLKTLLNENGMDDGMIRKKLHDIFGIVMGLLC